MNSFLRQVLCSTNYSWPNSACKWRAPSKLHVYCTCSVATLRGTDRHKFPHILYQNLKVWIIMATTHTSISIARPLGYEMWPKSACDFLAHLLPPRNRRLAGGYFGLRTPILCSIEFGGGAAHRKQFIVRVTRGCFNRIKNYVFVLH